MVLIFVSSIVCFAAGEQPSGNDYYSIYSPRSYSTTWEKKTFWTAQNNLFQRLLFLIDGNGSSDTVSIRQRLLHLDNSTSDLPDLIDTLTDVTVGNHLGYYLKNTSDKVSSISSTSSSIFSTFSSYTSDFSFFTSDFHSFLSYFGDPLGEGWPSVVSILSSQYNELQQIATDQYSTYSTLLLTRNLVNNIANNISDLTDYFIDYDKLAAEYRNEEVQNAVLDDFITGSDSSVSLGTGKVGSIKNIGSSFSSSFSSDASPADTFSILTSDSDDGFWSFFGSSVYNELNPSSGGLSLSSSHGYIADPLARYSSFFGGED